MTNLEFYKDEIIENIKETRSLSMAIIVVYNKHVIRKYVIKKRVEFEEVIYWLTREHKETIKLTLVEKCILESINKVFKYIARDKNKELTVFEYKPIKDVNGTWTLCKSGLLCTLFPFDHLFQFIKCEDENPYLIEDILNNCEVIE
ncbi:MAG: hypothetical protein HFF36_09660 [Coprobacillus sp.]|nr:hypothetical protein [Coprobacillus sp.]